jgi:hypothetical protein
MPGLSAMPVGYQQANSDFLNDTIENLAPGQIIVGQDPYWGSRELMYVKAGGTIRQFGLCVVTPSLSGGKMVYTATEAPNTAGLGRSLGVALVGATIGQYLWLCMTGLVPVNCTASVAADTAFGIVAAGQGGAIAAGKQVLNARSILPASTTVAKANATGAAGSLVIQVAESSGWFIGAYLSGTGVGAAAKITSIDPSGRFVTVDVANSAAINGTVTATYNNTVIFYNVALINRPFAQGQIT